MKSKSIVFLFLLFINLNCSTNPPVLNEPQPYDDQYKNYFIINHGIIFYPNKLIGLDTIFLSYFNNAKFNLNRNLDSTLKNDRFKNWNFASEKDLQSDNIYQSNIIHMAFILNRAGLDEIKYLVDEQHGYLYKNVFNIGMSLIFFRMTDQNSKEGIQLYYSRNITTEKIVSEEKKLSSLDKKKYYKLACEETIDRLIQNAYNEYNPEVVKGKILSVDNNRIVTSLSKKDGLLKNQFINVKIKIKSFDYFITKELSFIINELTLTNAIATPSLDNTDLSSIRPGYIVEAVINAKRISNSYQTFQLGTFTIKKEADLLHKHKDAFIQVFHDYLVQTKKINMLPSKAVISPITIDSFKAKFNIPISTEIKLPDADYVINTALLKLTSSPLNQGSIDAYKLYISYLLAGVRKNYGSNNYGKLLIKETYDAHNEFHIIRGKTYDDKMVYYDVTQSGLKSLAEKISNAIHSKINLKY